MKTNQYQKIIFLFSFLIFTLFTALQMTAQPPTLTVPPPLVLDCGDINETTDPSAQISDWLGDASAIVTCGNSAVINQDFSATSLNICAPATYAITVTWTAIDDCGGTSTSSQTITVIPDTQIPSITVPSPLVLDCGDISETSDPSAQILDWLGSASASDNCDTDPELSYDFSMSQLNICAPASYVITVTWTATDHCNNSTTRTQTITVIPDTQIPSITVPSPLVLDCGDISETSDPSVQILDWLGSASASDNCDTDPELTYDFNMTQLNICAPASYVITVTWRANDHCNNSTTRTQTITVVPDTDPPTVTAPANLILDCKQDQLSTLLTILEWQEQYTVSDNCDTDPVVKHSMSSTTIDFCKGDDITVTWTAKDHCGNLNTTSATIVVNPDLAPVLTCPANSTLNCNQPVVFGIPTVADGCSNATIAVVSTTVSAGPSGSLVHCRTWLATDNCGNQSDPCSQCITVPPLLTIELGPNRLVYRGYPDSACVKLQPTVTGGVAPRNLSWSNGSSAAFITVCPTVNTVYYVTVTDANGCTATDSVKVCVMDVRCGNTLNKVIICHGDGSSQNPFVTSCESMNAAKSHLKKHAADRLGPCNINRACDWDVPTARLAASEMEEIPGEADYLMAFPNPFSNATTIRFMLPENDFVNVRVFDIAGREIQSLYEGITEAGNLYELTFDGSGYTNGIYFVSLSNKEGERLVKKLVLAR